MLVGVGGLAVTVKALGLVAVPAAVVLFFNHTAAPESSALSMHVAEPIEKAALTPLNFTAVAPVKFVPLICTLVPTCPVTGVKLVIVGGLAVTVNALGLVAVPAAVVTVSAPLAAPCGTVA